MAHLVIGDAASFLGAKDVAPFLKAGDHAFDRDGEVVECGRVIVASRHKHALCLGKIDSRLEMDSRWALARSVSALVAERDALKENLKAMSRSNR